MNLYEVAERHSTYDINQLGSLRKVSNLPRMTAKTKDSFPKKKILAVWILNCFSVSSNYVQSSKFPDLCKFSKTNILNILANLNYNIT